MKNQEQYKLLLSQLAPRSGAELAVAMQAIEISEGEWPTLPNKKYSTREEWERGYRRWRISREEDARQQLLKSAKFHLNSGTFHHHVRHHMSFGITVWRVRVDVLEPGIDFQVATRLMCLDRHGNREYDVRVSALGTSVSEQEGWTVDTYVSATLADYIGHVAYVAKKHAVFLYDEGAGQQNVPHHPDREETIWRLGLQPVTD